MSKTVYIEMPVSEELPAKTGQYYTICEYKTIIPEREIHAIWYQANMRKFDYENITHWLKPIPLESLTGELQNEIERLQLSLKKADEREVMRMENISRITADKDAEIQRLREALKAIGDVAESEAKSINPQEWNHCLAADIPHMVGMALFEPKEDENGNTEIPF